MPVLVDCYVVRRDGIKHGETVGKINGELMEERGMIRGPIERISDLQQSWNDGFRFGVPRAAPLAFRITSIGSEWILDACIDGQLTLPEWMSVKVILDVGKVALVRIRIGADRKRSACHDVRCSVDCRFDCSMGSSVGSGAGGMVCHSIECRFDRRGDGSVALTFGCTFGHTTDCRVVGSMNTSVGYPLDDSVVYNLRDPLRKAIWFSRTRSEDFGKFFKSKTQWVVIDVDTENVDQSDEVAATGEVTHVQRMGRIVTSCEEDVGTLRTVDKHAKGSGDFDVSIFFINVPHVDEIEKAMRTREGGKEGRKRALFWFTQPKLGHGLGKSRQIGKDFDDNVTTIQPEATKLAFDGEVQDVSCVLASDRTGADQTVEEPIGVAVDEDRDIGKAFDVRSWLSALLPGK